jgi:predicted transcriptional regulator
MAAPYTLTTEYKTLLDRVNTGEDIEELCQDIVELCEACQPSSPVLCMELCQIWQLKNKFQKSFQALSKQPSLADTLQPLQNTIRLKIMELIIQQPRSSDALTSDLKKQGYSLSLSRLRKRHLSALLNANLVQQRTTHLVATKMGRHLYNLLTKSDFSNYAYHIDKTDEAILKLLLSKEMTHDELAEKVPRNTLHRGLNKLQRKKLVEKFRFTGRVFYSRAKRRPTRKLTPTEMKIFKALPKEGITVRDLGEKTKLSFGTVYKYLRQLKYKRHVKKVQKATPFKLTETGLHIAQTIKLAQSLLHSNRY